MEFIKENTISAVTVALVSIPLSFALAITSGVNPIMGF
jgi:MFS superfamily sulfate permease-like transporter